MKEKIKMVKFRGLDCEFDEDGEPIVPENGAVIAVFSFNADIPKGYRDGAKKNPKYKDVTVGVIMRTTVDYMTPFKDWKISAQSFADIWTNACKRHQRHVFEASMAEVGVTFATTGDSYVVPAESLIELHKKVEYING
jgi:hypothetical protein